MTDPEGHPRFEVRGYEGAAFTDYYGQLSCTAGRAAFITGVIWLFEGRTTRIARLRCSCGSAVPSGVAGIALSTTAVRPPGTWRYNVEGLHPICGAIVWSRECPPQAGNRLKRSGNIRPALALSRTSDNDAS
jgi:hypothetical protein